MNREHVSKSSIEINATTSEVWKILTKPEAMKQYFFGAEVNTDWKKNSPITFEGEFNGNKYEEKGIIKEVSKDIRLQYSHWSNFDGLPDLQEHYRLWTFDLSEINGQCRLSITEDNIPTEDKRKRSDEFWKGVLSTIKKMIEE